MPTAKFAFMKLVVRDLDAMSAFYQRTFGLVPARTIETDSIIEVIMRPHGEANGFCLVLYKPKDGGTIALGNAHGPLGFYVENIDQAFQEAIREGAIPQRDPFDVSGLRVAFVTDPEGHELELLSPIAREARR